MLEVKVTLANDDLEPVLDWIEDMEADLTEAMIAGRPTRESDQATLVFSVLERIRAQIRTFRTKLESLEEEARRR